MIFFLSSPRLPVLSSHAGESLFFYDTRPGKCPESTVGIELVSLLARSIVWVICRISGKMKALSTVLRAPAVVSLIAAETESTRGERHTERQRASVSNAVKDHMLNCLAAIYSRVTAGLFHKDIKMIINMRVPL